MTVINLQSFSRARQRFSERENVNASGLGAAEPHVLEFPRCDPISPLLRAWARAVRHRELTPQEGLACAAVGPHDG
jgi:hypothetical protein